MPRNNSVEEDTTEHFEVEDAPVAVAPAAGPLPYGQNIGDIVDAAEARGGQYEAVGAGKMRRIA